MMRRLLPSPVLSIFLFGLWLLLNQSVAAGQLLLGAVLAVLVPVLTAGLRPEMPAARRPGAALRLLGRVAVDVVRSNLAVAAVVLGGRRRHQSSGFMQIPLDIRDPRALAVLACILTACPGTVWAGIAEEDDGGSLLTIHVLDLRDEGEWIAIVKYRYEELLMEIFE